MCARQKGEVFDPPPHCRGRGAVVSGAEKQWRDLRNVGLLFGGVPSLTVLRQRHQRGEMMWVCCGLGGQGPPCRVGG